MDCGRSGAYRRRALRRGLSPYPMESVQPPTGEFRNPYNLPPGNFAIRTTSHRGKPNGGDSVSYGRIRTCDFQNPPEYLQRDTEKGGAFFPDGKARPQEEKTSPRRRLHGSLRHLEASGGPREGLARHTHSLRPPGRDAAGKMGPPTPRPARRTTPSDRLLEIVRAYGIATPMRFASEGWP